MKELKDLLPQAISEVSVMPSMQSLPQTELNEISVYTGAIITRDEVKVGFTKLAIAFPEVSTDQGYFALLTDRLIKNGFTKERLDDAINFVIDNFRYRRPNISEIIGYDRQIKAYTYDEIAAKCYPGYSHFEKVERVEINGRIRYIEK